VKPRGPRVFECRLCKGRGGALCEKHRNIAGLTVLLARRPRDRGGYGCSYSDWDGGCSPCGCCHGSGEHLGGVCAKDLAGADGALL